MSEEISEIEKLKKDNKQYYTWWQEEVKETEKLQKKINDLKAEVEILNYQANHSAKQIKTWKVLAENQLEDIAYLKVKLLQYQEENNET